MPEPAAPHPDPSPATTRPRPSPNGTAPPKPSVPPMPSEATKAHAHTAARGRHVPHGDVAAAQDDAPSPPRCVIPAGAEAVRGHHGLPCATRPVPTHVIGSAVTYSAAHNASLSLTGQNAAATSSPRSAGNSHRRQLPPCASSSSPLRPAASQLIIDLSAVEHADANGPAVLVSSGHRAGLLGGSLRLAAPSPEVARVLSATGINQHLDIFPTVRAAITGQPRLPEAVFPPANCPGSWPPHRWRHRGRGYTIG